MDKNEVIKLLEELNLDKEEYVILSSGSAAFIAMPCKISMTATAKKLIATLTFLFIFFTPDTLKRLCYIICSPNS